MLSIGLISLLVAIPVFSYRITPSLFNRITSVVLIYSALLAFNGLHIESLASGVGIYSGLFHVTTLSVAIEGFLLFTGALILLGWGPITEKTNVSNSLRTTTVIPSISEYSLMILFTSMGATLLLSSSDLVSIPPLIGFFAKQMVLYSSTHGGALYFTDKRSSIRALLLAPMQAGAFQRNPVFAVLGSTGIVLSAAYSIWLYNRIAFGAWSKYLNYTTDITRREFMLLLPLLFVAVVFVIEPIVMAPMQRWADANEVGYSGLSEPFLFIIKAVIFLCFPFLLSLLFYRFVQTRQDEITVSIKDDTMIAHNTNFWNTFAALSVYSIYKGTQAKTPVGKGIGTIALIAVSAAATYTMHEVTSTVQATGTVARINRSLRTKTNSVILVVTQLQISEVLIQCIRHSKKPSAVSYRLAIFTSS
ncbi:hypothetical protein L6452_46452 [Arctium lappa]|nr:hypothetical protein L6452_46452 [Arctium lappa]